MQHQLREKEKDLQIIIEEKEKDLERCESLSRQNERNQDEIHNKEREFSQMLNKKKQIEKDLEGCRKQYLAAHQKLQEEKRAK